MLTQLTLSRRCAVASEEAKTNHADIVKTATTKKGKQMKPSIDHWKPLQGWLSDLEGDKLQQLAKDGVVLEIGCWKGKSTLAMAATAKHVISVDGFNGDNFAGPYDTSKEAKANLAGFNISLIHLPWEDVLPFLDLRKFDLIYYDADHTYEATRAFLTMCPPEILLAAHDYDDNPNHAGCRQAVDELHRELIITDRLATLLPGKVES